MGPTRTRSTIYIIGCSVIVALAVWLRVEDALRRQYHADEGVQSYQAWRLIETGEYRYDPAEHHGPTLYYLTSWFYPFISDRAGELSDFRMRLIPIAFSLAMIAFGLWAFRPFGRVAALLWALLVAIAPLAIIYGSYYIQESLLAFLTILSAYLLFRYLEKPKRLGAVAIGFGFGLMHVTKETAVLHIFALLVSAFVTGLVDQRTRTLLSSRWWKDAGAAAGVVIVLHFVFFSSFFSNVSGAGDALLAFFNYAERSQGQGHEKSALYYLSILLPQTREGVKWGELALLCCVFVGLILVVLDRVKTISMASRFGCYFACFGVMLFLLYSAIPYKTPWLLLTSYIVLCYAASYGFTRLARQAWNRDNGWRYLPAGVSVVLSVWVVGEVAFRSRQAVFRYPSATRNPYLYEHTTPRYERLLGRIEKVAAASPEDALSIGVYSPDGAWPLPWHLRLHENVGYWNSMDAFLPHSMDIIDTRLFNDTGFPSGQENDLWELHGLRPNTLISLRISGELKHAVINK